GYLPTRRRFTLERGRREVVSVSLERDMSAPLWAEPSRFFAEIDGGLALGAIFGGDVVNGCGTGCTRSLPLGSHVVAHLGFLLGFGLGLSVDAGYLILVESVDGRAVSPKPIASPAHETGRTSDSLQLSRLTLGASGAFHRGANWPLTLRLGAGFLLGAMIDRR